MATKKITELVEIISAANDDVLPIVDISTDITNKIKVENLPISTSVQTALNGKENTIGYTTENVANKSTSVTTDQASNTKYPSVKAVYDWAVGLFATLSQLATKQDTLVSGTNIKTVNSTSLLGSGNVSVQETLVSGTNIRTINSTSLLGSGDISIQANPSGVSGAIQFSNGSAFASDASNLFWDDTNKRLGIGFNSPTARLQVRGSGTTSATTALLVQNSSGSNALKVQDDGRVYLNSIVRENSSNLTAILLEDTNTVGNGILFSVRNNSTNTFKFLGQNRYYFTLSVGDQQGAAWFGSSSSLVTPNSSAQVQIDSTTKGFLPPRMTTTQKNAISSPAAGLQVYDTTLNQMSYYNGTSWVNF